MRKLYQKLNDFSTVARKYLGFRIIENKNINHRIIYFFSKEKALTRTWHLRKPLAGGELQQKPFAISHRSSDNTFHLASNKQNKRCPGHPTEHRLILTAADGFKPV